MVLPTLPSFRELDALKLIKDQKLTEVMGLHVYLLNSIVAPKGMASTSMFESYRVWISYREQDFRPNTKGVFNFTFFKQFWIACNHSIVWAILD